MERRLCGEPWYSRWGFAIGALNSLIAKSVDVHPLIVPLGICAVVQALVFLATGGFPSGSVPQSVADFVVIGGSVALLPVPWR